MTRSAAFTPVSSARTEQIQTQIGPASPITPARGLKQPRGTTEKPLTVASLSRMIRQPANPRGIANSPVVATGKAATENVSEASPGIPTSSTLASTAETAAALTRYQEEVEAPTGGVDAPERSMLARPSAPIVATDFTDAGSTLQGSTLQDALSRSRVSALDLSFAHTNDSGSDLMFSSSDEEQKDGGQLNHTAAGILQQVCAWLAFGSQRKPAGRKYSRKRNGTR